VVLSGVPRKKSPVTPPGKDPATVRLVAQRLNHYATPGPVVQAYLDIITTDKEFPNATASSDLSVKVTQGSASELLRIGHNIN